MSDGKDMAEFFRDLEARFKSTFGREMTPEERKYFAFAQHAVRNEEQRRSDKKKDGGNAA